MTLRLPSSILRHVYTSTASMKRRLRFSYSKLTYAPPLFHHLLQHFFSETLKLPLCDSSSPTSGFQKPLAINKRYPFSLSMAYLNTFYRLHHPITALCIRCGLFSLSLHCTRVSSGFSVFSLLLLRHFHFTTPFKP